MILCIYAGSGAWSGGGGGGMRNGRENILALEGTVNT